MAAPVSNFTKKLMAKFPSWMKMAKDPNSVGAQFLDIFGMTFTEFQEEFDEAIRNFYITTANTEIIDWIYKVPLIKEATVDATGAIDIQEIHLMDNDKDTHMIYRSQYVQNFYHRDAHLPSYWLDRTNEVLYLRVNLDDIADLDYPFHAVVINGTPHYNLFLHHVWNVFDEFGMLVGLKRQYKERNLFFKERILDVFRRPGNSSQEGLINGLQRELNLPDNSVVIQNLDDIERDDSLTLSDGTPTRKLMAYAKKINETLQYSWNELNLDEAYWFSISQEDIAIEYLPHIWDVDMSTFDKSEYQSGVGFDDDLYVHKPIDTPRTREVKLSIGLMGYVDNYEEVHPELTFKYRIYAEGKIIDKDYMPQDFKYTIKSTETFNQPYQIHAKADIHDTEQISMNNSLDMADGTTAPNISFTGSTDILHDQLHEMVKLSVRPERYSETETPNLKYLTLVWEDSTGAEQRFRFDSNSMFFVDQFNKNGHPMTNVLTSSMFYDATQGLILSKGVFQENIDTTEELKTGTWDNNNVLISNGTLELNLENLYGKDEFGPK